MDRYINQDHASFQPGTVRVDLEFTAGASGAVPTTLTTSYGITSVTKSTNDYIVKFDDTYFKFLGGFGNIVQATPAAGAAFDPKHTAFNAAAAGGATVTVTPHTAAGATNPLVVGDILQYTFFFSRMPPGG